MLRLKNRFSRSAGFVKWFVEDGHRFNRGCSLQVIRARNSTAAFSRHEGIGDNHIDIVQAIVLYHVLVVFGLENVEADFL